ncbi:MAG: hypothetical protein DSY42_05680 [Aquifex sp.]|nr:MAG: hypothetical protein DSY42_05680 [Aquifex sp.]
MSEFKPLEEFESLEEALEVLRGDVKAIKILRDGKYLATVYPEEIEGWDIQEWLKEKYGGGKYTLQLIKKDGKFGKSFTFMIEGKPKEVSEISHSDPAISVLVEQLKELKEEIRRLKGKEEGDIFKYLLEMEKQNRDEIFKLFLELIKSKEEKRSSFIEGLLKEAIKNPQLIGAIGTGVYKLIKTLMAKKDDLVELIKIAKDDPELKGVISEVLSAKYGVKGDFLSAIFENPELINKFLDTLNNLLSKRQVSNRVSNQYLTPVSNSVSNQLDYGPTGNLTDNLTQSSNDNLTGNLTEEEGEGEIEEGSILGVLLKVFNLLAQNLGSEEILKNLSETEKITLKEYLSETGIENSIELIGVLKASGIPKEYIEPLKEKKTVIDEIIGRLTATENTVP